MRKLFFLTLMFTVMSVGSLPMLAQGDPAWMCPAGFEGQTLSVYNRTMYIADDTIPNFEALCGVTVVYDTFPTDEDMLARIRQGNPGYDIVVPSGSTVSLMVAEGLLERLDYNNIPNIANITSELLAQPYDPGNVYSVPYQWGTIGIGYNSNTVSTEINSWHDLFNYSGPVAWLENNRATIGVALLLLGYDPNTGNVDEINQARDFLVENARNVIYIAPDDGQEVLISGAADLVVEYSGDIFQIMNECACDDYAYVIPEEGANIWIDNLAIPVDTPNKTLAEVFIDYVLDPQVGADISNSTAYASPNQSAIEQGLINADYLDNPTIYPTQEAIANMFFVESDPEMEQFYSNAWDEIRLLIGQ